MKEWIKGYTAGFLDGEGYIGILNSNLNSIQAKTGRKYYGVHVQFIQKDLKVLEWLKKQWGGGGIFISDHPNRKGGPVWRWCLHSKDAIRLLKEVYPYLIVKKEQAELAIQFPLKTARKKLPDEVYKLRCRLAGRMRALKYVQKEFRWEMKKI